MKTLSLPSVEEKSSSLIAACASYSEQANKPTQVVASRNLLRASTTMITCLRDSLSGFSRKEKVFNLYIALKEAREAQYWLKMMDKSNGESSIPLIAALDEMTNLITSLIQNTKKRRELEGKYI